MLKFNNNHIFTGFLKQLLASFNLPAYKVYTKEFIDYKDTYGYEDPRIISSDVKTDDSYPEHVHYVNYIKDNSIQRYYDGAWHPTTHQYFYNKKELNRTRTLKIKDNIYTSDTHEYLGEFLRFQRDYNNLDLMPLYNCFSDRLCPLIQTDFDVPIYVPVYDNDGTFNENKGYYETQEISIDSTDENYKIYMLPVKLFQSYTIAVSSQNVEVFCGFYSSYYDDRDKLKIIPSITYTHYSNMQFTQPVLYDRLSVENITTSEVKAAELAQIEKNLKMFIRLPKDTESSIVVLEGDYTEYNKSIFAPAQQFNSTIDGSSTTTSSTNTTSTITEYEYEDDFLRRLIGVTVINETTKNSNADGSETAAQQIKTVNTIIDYVPSNEVEFATRYTDEDINKVIQPFFNMLVGADETNLILSEFDNNVLIEGAPEGDNRSISSYLKPCTERVQITTDGKQETVYDDGLFVFTGELIFIADGTKNPLTEYYSDEDFKDYYASYRDLWGDADYAGYKPTLYDETGLLPIEARYSVTITTPITKELEDTLSSTDTFILVKDNDAFRLHLVQGSETSTIPFSLTVKESLVYSKSETTYQVVVDPVTGLPVYEQTVNEDDGSISWTEQHEAIPGEPIEYNSRTTILQRVPNEPQTEAEIADEKWAATWGWGTVELAECILSNETLYVSTPQALADGYILIKGQPYQIIQTTNDDGTVTETKQLITESILTSFNLNSRVTLTNIGSYAMSDPVTITPVSGNETTLDWKYQFLEDDSCISFTTSNAAKVIVYCSTNTDKVVLNLNSQDGTTIDSKTVPILQEDNIPSYVIFELTDGGSYEFKAKSSTDITIYYIEVLNNIIVTNTWQSASNSYITNFETWGFTTAVDENGDTIYDPETGEPESVEVMYPNIGDRTFKPITTLQLLQQNTGTSYPFADRLMEYLLGNAITHLDDTADNVKRVQKVISDNGNTFAINGAWDNKIRNIVYDYMIHGHPNGEKFSLEVNHDILGYIDKDVEKLYTSWAKTPRYDKNGNRIPETDENGNYVYKTTNKYLAANDGVKLKDNTGTSGRWLVVDDTTSEIVYKTKFSATGTIMNADIYEDEE